jgi:hypothetical protein
MHNRPTKKVKGLSDDKIRELLAKRRIRGNVIEDAILLRNHLDSWQTENDFVHPGPAWVIAHELEISESRVTRAWAEIKSDFWNREIGETAPEQPKGRGPKFYGIVSPKKNRSLLDKGIRIKRGYSRDETARLQSQCELRRDWETDPIKKEYDNMISYHLSQAIGLYDRVSQLEIERQNQNAA